MKLLILTQYYPPETGAPQNRLHELAVRLQQQGVTVHVLTAMPNYPKMEIFEAYRGKRRMEETIDGIRVFRASIFVKKSASIFYRLLNYFSFVYTSWRIGRTLDTKYDLVMVESPPLFLGISAYLLGLRWKAKMIFNVSDLWPESAEKLGLVTNRLFLRMATWLEEFLYRKATLVTGQTQGIVANISGRFPQKDVYWLPNGVDVGLFEKSRYEDPQKRVDWGFQENDLLFLYAGIIGHAQGLEVILKAASRLKDQPRVHFLLIGDGPVKGELIQLKETLEVSNVHFFDPVSKAEIPGIVANVDAAVVPLKKLPLFEGAIPSKIFENLAMEKPIVLGVQGEAEELFIQEGKSGVAFEPENDEELARVIREVAEERISLKELGRNGRTYVSRKFDRDRIASQFLEKLQHV